MRIKLEKGKQTDLIIKAKENKSWSRLSQMLKLSENYLRVSLKREARLLSEETYLKLCNLANKNYDKFITEKLKDNWGRSKGGKISSGSTKKVNFPQNSVELAEFIGVMLGDGNLNKIKAYKVGTYEARIVGDSRHDKEYLENYVSNLIEDLFKIKTRIYKSPNQNAIVINAQGKKLVEFLESRGLIPGNKIRSQVTIPKWIKENKSFLRVCLRGLYDTDGSVYKLTNQNSFQFSFRNYNTTLLKDVREALISLGINPSQISKGNEITITKKSELRKFLNGIGFSNSKHLNKVKMWNLNSPIV